MKKVMVIIGSATDKNTILPCLETLQQLGIEFSVTISSAHRTPQRTVEIIEKAELNGTGIFICAAGMAAHLAGAVAARTLRPVIAIPVSGTPLSGMDALFSTVQMPSGFPVATVALNGARNAALLAAQIIALNNAKLYEKLQKYRHNMATAIAADAEKLEKEWNADKAEL